MPLIRFAVAVSPWPVTAWPTRLAVLVVVPAVALALAAVTERKKNWWKAAAMRIFSLQWRVVK
jgi:hypothetical protein